MNPFCWGLVPGILVALMFLSVIAWFLAEILDNLHEKASERSAAEKGE